jgi:uncharacterized protein YegP (UPF0339 family)
MKPRKANCVYLHIYKMYRVMFRSRAMLIILLAAPIFSSAQVISFAGEWNGQIFVKQENRSQQLSLNIANEQVILLNEMYLKKEGNNKIIQSNKVEGNHLQHEWQRKRLFGTEVETFTLIPIHADTLQINWVRKCTVNQPLRDDTWTVSGSGFVVRKQDVVVMTPKL